MRVIYKNIDGSVGVLIPTVECTVFLFNVEVARRYPVTFYTETISVAEGDEIDELTLLKIAEKDVPFQLPYKIVNDSDIPTDRTYRNEWEWDSSIVPDGFGGESNEFDAELLEIYNGV